MARLIPSDPLELAWFASPSGGTAAFTVDNSTPGFGSPTLEIWERVIPWSAASPPPAPPPFTFVAKFTSLTPLSRPVPPLGGLYQCRLFFDGQGNASGTGNVLAKLDFPCLARALRANVLTRCANVPQIDITAGGTFVSMAFATAVATMVRAQMGVNPPSVITAGNPASFAPTDVVAREVSDGARLLQKVTLMDTLLPGNTVFFNILAWTAAGAWDFIWNTTGVAPTTAPESLTLKRRRVSVRVTKLHVFDDSDDLSGGEGEFKLVVSQAGTSQTRQFSSSFESGKPLSVPPSMNVDIGPENITAANHGVLVRVDGAEDDSGFPWLDDDDLASTTLTLGSGGQPLTFPVGEGKEEVISQPLSMPSKMLTSGDTFSFLAEIRYDVNYVP
ncbi:MAG: hypothetical protein LC791_19640 [Acidobacteria bacterium]|nr:hypothetical protein [Acidobacteriota bacterium]